MDLDLSDDQTSLRDGIAAMLSARIPIDRVRKGFDRAMFDELAGAGVFSLRADGFSWADCVVVFEQLGRHCVPGPLVPSLLLGDGRIAGLADAPPPVWIEHLDALDVLLLPGPDGMRIVDAAAIEADPSPWPLDPCTPVARATALPAGDPVKADERFRLAGTALTAALQLGLADRLTELAVTYAKERMQFDRPIGSFQAIKHMLADMLTRTEVARAAVFSAGTALDESSGPSAAARLVHGAKVVAGDAAVANGKAATQVFGGMGFTWEVDVHLYLKRAWVLETHFQGADENARVVCETVAPPRIDSAT
ncbi:MAG TPA: acyl-CoA dehydrogenase [Acidimicrobiia bacterium]|nr:acyl-CoA dehydrogenase [Acidimicrobiia bacterium]